VVVLLKAEFQLPEIPFGEVLPIEIGSPLQIEILGKFGVITGKIVEQTSLKQVETRLL
jgi:hypothetical protein